MDGPDDDYWPDEGPEVTCPECDGCGEVPCYCGGDLCVCDNYGDAPCHVCAGSGFVTEDRFDRYMENQRRNAEFMRTIMGKIDDGDPKDPTNAQ